MNNNTNDVLLYKVLRPLLKAFVYIFYRPKFIGRDNIKNHGPLILAGNHTNILDCLLLISSTKRQIHFLAKDELCKGFKKIIFSNMGLIPVNRRKKDPKALNNAKTYLNAAKVIGIFPEGTICKQKDKLLPFKIGAVKMAYDTNSEIVPFAIKGKYKIFKNDLTIVFGKPFNVKDDSLDKYNDILKDKVVRLKGDNI